MNQVQMWHPILTKYSTSQLRWDILTSSLLNPKQEVLSLHENPTLPSLVEGKEKKR